MVIAVKQRERAEAEGLVRLRVHAPDEAIWPLAQMKEPIDDRIGAHIETRDGIDNVR
ncbi:hypothetical protein PUN4_750017 [Paraburkholderia unamae]|nr:hypothetical protein PUN4_750017 [Paraburkholderia unamae]